MTPAKVPTRIFDKTGKETTVHKNPDVSPVSIRNRVASIAVPSGAPVYKTPKSVADDQVELTYLFKDISDLYQRDVASFVFEVNDYGSLEITDISDSSGARIYANFFPSESVERVNVNLNSISLDRAIDSGLVEADGQGSYGVSADVVSSFRA